MIDGAAISFLGGIWQADYFVLSVKNERVFRDRHCRMRGIAIWRGFDLKNKPKHCYVRVMDAENNTPIREMIAYWRRPYFHETRDGLTAHSLLDMVRLLGFCFFIVFLLALITQVIFQASGASRPDIRPEFIEMMNSPYFFLSVAIIVPFIEEILFRSWLGSVWGNLLILPLLLWFLALGLFLAEKSLPQSYDIAIIIALSVLFMLYFIQYCRTASRPGYHEAALRRIFPLIFWGTALGFGAIHLTNFAGAGASPLSLILVAPQIFMGAVLGYVRLRFGLISAIIFHGSYNGLLVSFASLVGG